MRGDQIHVVNQCVENAVNCMLEVDVAQLV